MSLSFQGSTPAWYVDLASSVAGPGSVRNVDSFSNSKAVGEPFFADGGETMTDGPFPCPALPSTGSDGRGVGGATVTTGTEDAGGS